MLKGWPHFSRPKNGGRRRVRLFIIPKTFPTNAETHYLWRGCLASSLHHPGFLQRSVAWPQRQRPIFHPTPPKQNGHDFCIFVAVNTYWEVNTNRSEKSRSCESHGNLPTHVFGWMQLGSSNFGMSNKLGSTGERCLRNPWKSKLRGPLNVKQTRPVFKQNKSWNVRCHNTKSCFTLRSLFLVKICLKKTAVGMSSFFFFRNGKSWSGWPGRSIHDHRLT